MSDVRCPLCYRQEHWDGAQLRVLQAGGTRRSELPPGLAQWRVLRDARAGRTGPVVGRCATCGAPMVADDATVPPLAEWIIATPAGDLSVGEQLVGPSGPLTEAEADQWLNAQLAVTTPRNVFGTLFELALFSTLGVPFVLWACSLAVTLYFFYGLWGGWIGMPDVR